MEDYDLGEQINNEICQEKRRLVYSFFKVMYNFRSTSHFLTNSGKFETMRTFS